MSDATLGPSAFIVLGLLAECGEGTSYDLKRWADTSVGYFWTFPRSQLYAEPQRLAALGLLSEQQEQGGRRRRTYAITPQGRAALRGWLGTPAGEPELRDAGLLKLFFGAQAAPGDIGRLAAEQVGLHRQRLADYENLVAEHIAPEHGEPDARHPVRMGVLYERASIAFWAEVQVSSTAAPEQGTPPWLSGLPRR